MRTKYLRIFWLMLAIFMPLKNASAEAIRPSISDLPFSGYYLATTEHVVDGLLFEGNQLYIYLSTPSAHSHEEEMEAVEDDALKGQQLVTFLEELHSFPHPDLKNSSESVRDLYLEDYDLPYDLQAIYQEVTSMITPELSQTDIQNLINNRVPGIFYTEKNHYQYYIIASPTVIEDNNTWQINLFGEELYRFEVDETQAVIIDQEGIIYENIPGIKP